MVSIYLMEGKFFVLSSLITSTSCYDLWIYCKYLDLNVLFQSLYLRSLDIYVVYFLPVCCSYVVSRRGKAASKWLVVNTRRPGPFKIRHKLLPKVGVVRDEHEISEANKSSLGEEDACREGRGTKEKKNSLPKGESLYDASLATYKK